MRSNRELLQPISLRVLLRLPTDDIIQCLLMYSTRLPHTLSRRIRPTQQAATGTHLQIRVGLCACISHSAYFMRFQLLKLPNAQFLWQSVSTYSHLYRCREAPGQRCMTPKSETQGVDVGSWLSQIAGGYMIQKHFLADNHVGCCTRARRLWLLNQGT